jgi:hypothetical protein
MKMTEKNFPLFLGNEVSFVDSGSLRKKLHNSERKTKQKKTKTKNTFSNFGNL